MFQIYWNALKSRRLKQTRDVSFEEILQAKLISVRKHPARKDQNIFLFEHRNYIWVVPFIVDNDRIFLKTLYPSRKYTKFYKKESDQ